MWFKNLQVYRFTRPFELTAEQLETQLEACAFTPCGSQDLSRFGWTRPLGKFGSTLTHAADGQILLCARREDKILPTAVIKEALAEKVEAIEYEQGRALKKKEKEALKEVLLHTLFPRAFSRTANTFAWINPADGLLMVDASSAKKADDVLREAARVIPAIGVAIDDMPVVDAFLERIEAALAGQVLERIGSNALAMMMDELHDICVGLDAPGGAQNGAEVWDRVKGARDRVLASLHQGRPDTEWTDTTTSPVSADYRELQEQHDQLQSTHKGTLVLLHEAHEVMRRVIPPLPQDCAKRGDLLDRIEVALAGKAKRRTITEGQEIELTTVLQSIASGFSDDPAHDAAALLKRIAGEVPWTGDTFQLLSRQADLPCNQPPSLTGQVFAGLSAATALSGLDASSAADVARLILEAAEAKGGEPCATASPSSSKA